MDSWIPYGVTDFASTLAKRVDEHKRQIAEHAANKDIQSKQIEEADPDVTKLKTVKGLLDLGKVAAKYGRTTEKNAKAKQDKLQTETNNKITLLASSKDSKIYLDRVLKYNNGVRDIKGATEGYDGLVNGLNVDQKLIDYLRNANPKETLRIKESRIIRYADEVKSKYEAQINALSPEAKLEWDQKNAGSTDNVIADILKFTGNDLAPLGISDEMLIGSGGFDKIKQHAGTIAGLDLAAYEIKSLTDEGNRFQDKIDLAIAKKNVNGNNMSEVVQAQINTEGKDTVLSRLALAASTSDVKHQLNHIELSNIQSGLIEHPAGEIVVKEGDQYNLQGFKVGAKLGEGKLLFKPEDWARLTKIVNTKNAASVKVHDNANKVNITNSIALGQKGQLTSQAKQNALISYLNAGGNDQDQLYKDLSNLSLQFQSDGYYIAESAEIYENINNGQIETVMANIGQIKNTKLKKEFEQKKIDFEAAKKQARYSDDFAVETKADINKVLTTKILPGEAIPTGTPRSASTYIARHRARIFAEEFFKGSPNDPTLGDRVEARVDLFLTSKGLKEKWDSPNAGILTPNNIGEFPNIIPGSKAREGALEEYSSSVSQRFDTTVKELNHIWTKIKGPSGNQKERALNTKGLILSNSELVAVQEYGFKNGVFQGFPKDILLKAEVLGIQPSVLVKRQLAALIASDEQDDKLLVQYSGLDKFYGALEKTTFPDVKLREIIETTGDKDLLYGYEHLGINNLTQNQIQRLNAYETKVEENDPIRISKQFYIDNDAAGAAKDFNEKYPQNNITVNDLFWNPQTEQWDLRLKGRDLIPTITQR